MSGGTGLSLNNLNFEIYAEKERSWDDVDEKNAVIKMMDYIERYHHTR